MYQLHAKAFQDMEALRKQADQAVEDLRDIVGMDPGIEIHVEPEAKRKGLYKVTLEVDVPGSTIVVRKSGRRVFSLLQKVKRTVIKTYMKKHKKFQSKRRRFQLPRFAWEVA